MDWEHCCCHFKSKLFTPDTRHGYGNTTFHKEKETVKYLCIYRENTPHRPYERMMRAVELTPPCTSNSHFVKPLEVLRYCLY
jgi:hypothetical protein